MSPAISPRPDILVIPLMTKSARGVLPVPCSRTHEPLHGPLFITTQRKDGIYGYLTMHRKDLDRVAQLAQLAKNMNITINDSDYHYRNCTITWCPETNVLSSETNDAVSIDTTDLELTQLFIGSNYVSAVVQGSLVLGDSWTELSFDITDDIQSEPAYEEPTLLNPET